MSSQSITPRPLPLWLKAGASAFALWHLGAIALLAIGAPSGPWMHPKFGYVQADGPRFAAVVNNGLTYPIYLDPLRMSHNYHFETNRLQQPGAYFEVHLKTELGQVTTLKFPDDKANPWVRHRQGVLAKALAQDLPPMQRGTQKIAPIGQEEEKTVEIWESQPDGTARLVKVSENKAQDMQAARPAPMSKVLAQSYMKYLCREHKAVSAELIRVTQPQPIPTPLFLPGAIPAEDFNMFKNSFGEYRRE